MGGYPKEEKSNGRVVVFVGICVILILATAAVVFMFVQQRAMVKHVAGIEEEQRRLSMVCGIQAYDQGDQRRYKLNFAWDSAPSDLSSLHRFRRGIGQRREEGDSGSEKLWKKCEKETKKLTKRVKRQDKVFSRRLNSLQTELLELGGVVDSMSLNQVTTGHFFASVDPRLVYETYATQENVHTDIGELTPDGLIPEGHNYKFWNVSHWTSSGFSYNSQTGRVAVQEEGIYLIYAQIVYHDSTNRNSFGIYIGEDTEPIAQCLAFDVRSRSHHTRHSASTSTDENYTYQQCSTMAVRKISENEDIYLKGAYVNRTLVARAPLTFWEIAKLG